MSQKYMVYMHLNLIHLLPQKCLITLLPALLKPSNLMLVQCKNQKALPPVDQYTVAVPASLQVRNLRSHHLGVGVASAHCPAS